REFLSTQVKGGVAVEKAGPVLVLAGGRFLVGDHRHDAHHIAALDDVRQQVLGRHQAAAETRSHFLHLALRPVVHQRLVGGIERIAELRDSASSIHSQLHWWAATSSTDWPCARSARGASRFTMRDRKRISCAGSVTDLMTSTSICAKPR